MSSAKPSKRSRLDLKRGFAADPISAEAFGVIEVGVSAGQAGQRGLVAMNDGNPGTHCHFVAVDQVLTGDRASELMREESGCVWFNLRKKQAKRRPAVVDEEIGSEPTDPAVHKLDDAVQNVIGHRMAKGLADVLEVIDLDRYDRCVRPELALGSDEAIDADPKEAKCQPERCDHRAASSGPSAMRWAGLGTRAWCHAAPSALVAAPGARSGKITLPS